MTERLRFHFSLSCIGEGNGNPLQCSCLENPRDGGAWWAAVCGVAQSRTRLKWLGSSSMASLISDLGWPLQNEDCSTDLLQLVGETWLFAGETILYSLDGHTWTVFLIMNCLEMAFGKRHLNTVSDLQLYSYIISLWNKGSKVCIAGLGWEIGNKQKRTW